MLVIKPYPIDGSTNMYKVGAPAKLRDDSPLPCLGTSEFPRTKLLGHLRHPDVTSPIAPVRWAEVPDLAPPL